jgi:hypothetical protein
LEVLRVLVERTPATVKMTDDGGELPLPFHFACNRQASVTVIRYLLGIDPFAVKTTNTDGNLPLHLACVGRGAGFGEREPRRCQDGQR